MDSLQITLVAGLIVMGCINAASLIWVFVLDHRLRRRPTPKVYQVKVEAAKVFSDQDMAEIAQRADGQLHQIVQTAAQKLQESLNQSIGQIAEHINDNTNMALNEEFQRYKITLKTLNDQSVQAFSGLQDELEQKRTELITQLEDEVKAEQERRLEQFSSRLDDVISGYLAESLGTQVDLGAQSAYIFQTLEAHKEDIKRDLLS